MYQLFKNIINNNMQCLQRLPKQYFRVIETQWLKYGWIMSAFCIEYLLPTLFFYLCWINVIFLNSFNAYILIQNFSMFTSKLKNMYLFL